MRQKSGLGSRKGRWSRKVGDQSASNTSGDFIGKGSLLIRQKGSIPLSLVCKSYTVWAETNLPFVCLYS